MSTRPRWAAVAAVTALTLAVPTGVHATPPDVGADADADVAAAVTPDLRLSLLPVDVPPVEFDPPGAVGTDPDLPDRVGDVPEFGPTSGSEVGLTNADAWHAAGITGAGVKIGVIDFFDVRYWDVAEHGPLPIKNVTARCFAFGNDCSQRFYDGFDDGGEDHGVAVVEVIRDIAPDAEIFIGTALTPSDYRRVIEWFHASGVTVLNRSLGGRYDGPGDGRGVLDEIADYANSLGITWVNSGGNNASGRYYRHPVRLAGNRVAFGPSGSTVALPFRGCVSLGGVRWANDWDLAPADRTDYDVYLWEGSSGSPFDRLLASSDADQRAGDVPIELITGQFCPASSTRQLFLEIRLRAGDPTGDVIEILDYGQGMSAHTQAAYSGSTPIGDSRAEGVLAVGAVDPPGSGSIAFYSSQGPTNDGRIAPDVSAPSGFSSRVLGTFAGTSAAAPVVTGGVALLTQARLASGPAGYGNLVRHLTVDRGRAGPDQQFGAGEFRLPDPPSPPRSVPSAFEPLGAPVRVLDTRPESAIGPADLIGGVPPGGVIDLPLTGVVPPDATAVALNVTVTQVDRPSFVQALPTLGAAIGGFSNLNVDTPGQTRANLALVAVSSQRSVSFHTNGAGQVVVDLLGWFREVPGAVTAGRFVELPAPVRALDTRLGSGAPLASGGTIAVPAVPGLPSGEVAALVVTVTGTAATGPGWLQAHPADRPDIIGTTSTVNVDAGVTVANTAIVPVGAGGVAVSGFAVGGSTHVVVDVIGYMTSAAAPPDTVGRFVPVVPGRVFDSRTSAELRSGVPVEVDAAATGLVPPSATGVAWNVTHVLVRRPGFGRVWATGAAEPATSAFNFSQAAEVRATSVVSAVDGARARMSVSDGVPGEGDVLGHLVVDVFGYFT